MRFFLLLHHILSGDLVAKHAVRQTHVPSTTKRVATLGVQPSRHLHLVPAHLRTSAKT